MYYEPVCDMENKVYDNKECALCKGIPEEGIQPCAPSGIIGGEEGILFWIQANCFTFIFIFSYCIIIYESKKLNVQAKGFPLLIWLIHI